MQRKVLSYYFIFSLIIGTLIYIAQKTKIQLPNIINNYVNDFLIIPIILIPSLFILQWSRSDKNYRISFWVIIYICSLYALLFEFLIPKYHPRYTADLIDVILYFAGGFVFYYLQNVTYVINKQNNY